MKFFLFSLFLFPFFVFADYTRTVTISYSNFDTADEWIDWATIDSVPVYVSGNVPAGVYLVVAGNSLTTYGNPQATTLDNRKLTAMGFGKVTTVLFGNATLPVNFSLTLRYEGTDPDPGGGDSGGGDSGDGGDSGGGDSGGDDSGDGESAGKAYALESSLQTLISVIRNTSNDYLYRILTSNESLYSKLSSLFTDFTSYSSSVTSSLSSIGSIVTSISGKVTSIQSDVGTIKDKVTTIKDDVSIIKSDINTIRTNTSDTKQILSEIKDKFNGSLPTTPTRLSSVSPTSSALDQIKRKLLPSYNFFNNPGSSHMHFDFVFSTSDFGFPSIALRFDYPWTEGTNNYDRGSFNQFVKLFRKIFVVLLAWCFLKTIIKTLRQW